MQVKSGKLPNSFLIDGLLELKDFVSDPAKLLDLKEDIKLFDEKYAIANTKANEVEYEYSKLKEIADKLEVEKAKLEEDKQELFKNKLSVSELESSLLKKEKEFLIYQSEALKALEEDKIQFELKDKKADKAEKESLESKDKYEKLSAELELKLAKLKEMVG